MDFDQEAVLAGDSVALADLGEALGQFCDLRELTWAGPYSDEGGHGVAEGRGIDVQAVATDHAALLQPAQAVPSGGDRDLDTPGQFRGGQAGVGGQFRQESPVESIHFHHHQPWSRYE